MKTGIRAAAVKHIRTGLIFASTCHAFALVEADAGLKSNEPEDRFYYGFLTTSGEFVEDRTEAYQIGEANGQIDYDSEYIGHTNGQLISEICNFV